MEELLQQCPLFKKLSQAQLEGILQKYPHQVKTFGEKDFVILQNEPCDHLMVVVEGLVQAQMVDSSGKLIVIEELGVNQLLAPAFLFSDVNAMPVSVLALNQTRVLYFQRQVLLDMMQENQTVLLNFLAMISNRSRFLSQRLKFHALMSLRSKLTFYLLEEYTQQGSLQLRLRHTQQELADRFGVARPSLARMFAELEKEGIIELKNKELLIKKLAELRKEMS